MFHKFEKTVISRASIGLTSALSANYYYIVGIFLMWMFIL